MERTRGSAEEGKRGKLSYDAADAEQRGKERKKEKNLGSGAVCAPRDESFVPKTCHSNHTLLLDIALALAEFLWARDLDLARERPRDSFTSFLPHVPNYSLK